MLGEQGKAQSPESESVERNLTALADLLRSLNTWVLPSQWLCKWNVCLCHQELLVTFCKKLTALGRSHRVTHPHNFLNLRIHSRMRDIF